MRRIKPVALRIKSSEERARLKLIRICLARKLPFCCADCGKPGVYTEIRKVRREGWVERRPKVSVLDVSHDNGDAFLNDEANLKWRCRPCHGKHDAALKRRLKEVGR